MKIIYEQKFKISLQDILDYISLDSKNRANIFKSNLKASIEKLEYFPYKYRKSIYFEDENIRDLIFSGYTIPYKIDTKNDKIIILGITKYQKKL